MQRFSRPFRSISEVLALIHQAPMGRAALTELLPQIESERIRILPFPQDIRNRLSEATGPEAPVGAAFVTDGEKGTIYVDFHGEIGIIAPFLFHEIIHSLDETLWRAARTAISKTERRNILFESECRAYRAQHLFQEELKALHPDLRDYHRTRYPTLPFLSRALEPHEIAGLYQNVA